MNKLIILIGLPILLFGAIDTTYVARLDVTTNPTDGVAGYDYQIWGHYSQDALGFHEDSVVWNGAVAGTLLILPPIEVGKFNLFAFEIFGDVDSLRIEYELEATLSDFDRTPWDWNELVALTPVDSMYRSGMLECDPWDKYIKVWLIDVAGRVRTLFYRFKLKESG